MKKIAKKLILAILTFTSIMILSSCSKDESNKPPTMPVNPTPANYADSVSILTSLKWDASIDPDNDYVLYDVYLGTSNPPALIQSDVFGIQFKPDTLTEYTKYYWKVVAKDNHSTTSSPVWQFTTGAPLMPNGNLKVMVCDNAQTVYYGGASVFLYNSEADRTNDPQRTAYFQKATTDNNDPMNSGAEFYNLPNRKYYVFCRRDNGGGNYFTGVGESIVPNGKVTSLIVKVQ